jgi:chromosome segregation protein
MHFKKLELVGFKSFLDKTTLHFEPGITAVVGPNGCGKSNIFDSIRWVLGEQSVKSLRGSEMQDVIFNGTDSKQPLGMAEVTVTFDNENRFFNIDHDEAAITRRIFRSGESEYLLNKTQVRLKDILDLLMGTGIGAESYSLVAQGKIDLVLSSRPEDRRLVFDEASGITKYKVQKKEAMRRLEETEQNLLRVNDIITEVKRQIGSLERQANKARKYKEVFEELKNREISLALSEKNRLIKEKHEITKQIGQLESQEAKLLEGIKEQESKISSHQQELKNLEYKLMSIKNEILNLDNLAIRNKERISFNLEKISELEESKKYLTTQIEQTKNRLILDEEKLNQAKEEYSNIHKNIADKQQALETKAQDLNNINTAIKAALETIAKTKKSILDLVAKVAGVKNDISDISTKQQMGLARKKRLEIEKAKVNEEKAVVEDNLRNITQELQNLEKVFLELNLKVSHLNQELDNEDISLNNLNTKIDDLKNQKLALESHKEFLDKLKTKYEDIGESMNAVIYLDKLPKEKLSGLVVKIKDYLKLDNQDETQAEIRNLKLSGEPRINPADFLRGEAKPIDLDTQKINQKIGEIQKDLDAMKDAKTVKENKMEELNKAVHNLQQELRQQEITLANKKANQQTILEQVNKVKEEENIVTMELDDVEKELLVLNEKISNLQVNLNEAEGAYRQAEDLIVNAQNTISQNTSLKEKVLVAITQVKTELDALNRRINSDEATVRLLEDTYNQDKDSLLNQEKQLKDATCKKESLESEIKDLENKIEQARVDIQGQNTLLKETQEQYQGISNGSSDIVNKIELDRQELDGLKNKLYELQMQNKDLDFKYQSIKDRVLQIYKVDLEGIQDNAENIDGNVLVEGIKRLKEKVDSYGTVNLVAIEEYDELKKRYDFLIQQQNDLVTAKELLHEAILKINRTTRKMFLETFERVKEEFRNYFRLLFNGGDAQLFLIDEQDPLESGIEIICRPPGKKLQNVLLLSGGEKALSAIALIFAIFKVKPSPFCVLDEIDAALDEANVDRFTRLLQEFALESQFIVITHNKRTIVNASVMYGITMQESGVSKIVSVKFAKDKPKIDKEPDLAVPEPV